MTIQKGDVLKEKENGLKHFRVKLINAKDDNILKMNISYMIPCRHFVDLVDFLEKVKNSKKYKKFN